MAQENVLAFQLEPDEPPKQPAKADSAAVSVLMLALKTLSQRTVVALSKLFALATVGSVFWLWLTVHDPNAYQLAAMAMYALFILTINWIVRK